MRCAARILVTTAAPRTLGAAAQGRHRRALRLCCRSLSSSPAMAAPAKSNPPEAVPHADAAWAWWARLGAPRFWVAPMVDQSELTFRALCRRHGAHAAYTPMLHARLFSEGAAYRAEHFTTAPGDRPLLAQFCANDPDVLLAAARLVEGAVDGVDLNLGCPQRIASRGRYGAYLMDDLPRVEALVSTLARNLSVPVTVKIRVFPELADTLAYAAMLERAGASLIAVHGRTRAARKTSVCRADWGAIAAVKAAARVPVLANGNIRHLADVHACLAATGADGVMSAEALLADPALFSPARAAPGGGAGPRDGARALVEYCELEAAHGPTPWRMVKGHAFKLLGPWLAEYVDLRERLQAAQDMGAAELRALAEEVLRRIDAGGRDHPVPALSARKLAALEAEAAKRAAIEEQEREAAALRELGGGGELPAAAEPVAA